MTPPHVTKWSSPKRPKYGNTKVLDLNGQIFDSKLELERWQMLKLMERAGLIQDLERQVRILLIVGGVKVCTLVADFRMTIPGKGLHYEDAKGHETPASKLKRKLFAALFPGVPLHVYRKGEKDTLVEAINP